MVRRFTHSLSGNPLFEVVKTQIFTLINHPVTWSIVLWELWNVEHWNNANISFFIESKIFPRLFYTILNYPANGIQYWQRCTYRKNRFYNFILDELKTSVLPFCTKLTALVLISNAETKVKWSLLSKKLWFLFIQMIQYWTAHWLSIKVFD